MSICNHYSFARLLGIGYRDDYKGYNYEGGTPHLSIGYHLEPREFLLNYFLIIASRLGLNSFPRFH